MLRVACIRLYTAIIDEQKQFTTDSEAFGSVKGVFGVWCLFMFVQK